MSFKINLLTPDLTLEDALSAIDTSAIGMALLVDGDGRFLRTITDGDIRRRLIDGEGLDMLLSALPVVTSVTTTRTESPKSLLDKFNQNSIANIPLLDEDNRPCDIIRRTDIPDRILLSTPHLGSEEITYVNEAFASNWIAPLGPNVDAFERELAARVGSKAACALSSGTAAIHLALRLLDVENGDRVFVSDLTFVASINPIIYQSATPVLIDSEPDSWNMSPVALRSAFEDAERTGRMPKAVIVVSLYGQSADMDPLLEICNHYGVPVVEDAAESLGATYKGRVSGTMGTFGCYSFNGNKIITTSGGGMLIGENADQIARARYLAAQARVPVTHYEHIEVGYNYRMSNILAGVGRGQLNVLADRIARRRGINELYRAGLADIAELSFMPEPAWSFSNRWLSCVTVSGVGSDKSAAGLIAWLDQQMIEARPIWKPMHMQPMLKGTEAFAHCDGNRMVSREIFESGLCLPSGSNLGDDDIAKIVTATRAYFR